MFLSSRNKPIVGLDIGSHTIKAIVLDQTKSGFAIRNLGLAQISPEAIIDGEVQKPDEVIRTIKNLLKSLKIKVKEVCTSISGYSVIIKKITLPTTARDELARSIEVEAEQFIPFDISEVNVDFHILGPTPDNVEQMEVILAAAKKDVVEGYRDLLTQAKLRAKIIDVDVFALENAFVQSNPDAGETIALIDIGANKMNTNVIKEGLSLMTKDAAMGGARVTGEIQDRFDLSFEEAEAIKLGGSEAPDPEVVYEIISRATENWLAESKRAIDFLQATYPNENLQRIYLSGGSSRITGLPELFEQEIGIPVRLFNPFKNVGFDTSKFDPDYINYLAPQVAICLGLALRRGERF